MITILVGRALPGFTNRVWQLVSHKWVVVGYTCVWEVWELRMKHGNLYNRTCFAVEHPRKDG